MTFYQAAGVLVVAPTGRMLLCKRFDSGLWATPAGHVEPGERPIDAAVRELREETRYAGPVDVSPLGNCGRFALYLGTVPREFEPVIDHEHTAAAWFAPTLLPLNLHPGLVHILRS